jgi:hypothetical protein
MVFGEEYYILHTGPESNSAPHTGLKRLKALHRYSEFSLNPMRRDASVYTCESYEDWRHSA